MEKTFLTYEEFGAIGNGVNDDFDAIIACHNAANEMRLPVVAKKGATYYIGGSSKTAIVKTSVDFTGAKFIIDDRSLENITSYVFTVLSDYETQKISIDELFENIDDKEENSNIQIISLKPNTREWIRINGVAKECEDIEIKKKMLEECPVLSKHFRAPDTPHYVIFQIKISNVQFY